MNRRAADPFARLRSIPLERVLSLCGGQPERDDPRKWHTAQGVLSVTGPKFMNWSRGQGGGGAIDLAMHLQGLDFKSAVAWLADHFPQTEALDPVTVTPQPPPPWRAPPPAPCQLGRVRDYLVHARGIPPVVLESLIEGGTLYADARANAVFLLLGKDSSPVGAELRGTTERIWRGLATGSRKDRGYFSIPSAPPRPLPIILCESAIDAISCHVLHPQHRCLSTAGARPDPAWLPLLIEKAPQIACGFDCDAAGETMAEVMIARYPVITRLRPPCHDWNDALRARS